MKNAIVPVLLTVFLLLAGSPLFGQQKVDKMPEYPGGMEALMTYLGSNLKYPEAARKEKAEGMVVVKFVVQKNGKISKISTVNQGEPAREDFVKEAIRVIKSMPDWIPAEQDGKKVHCEMALPVKFKLG